MSEKLNVSMAESKSTWQKDALASVVVFLVALPLCMGIAIASGVPTEKAAAVGIISGIVGGVVVGPIAGSPLQVTGPAAGLAVIVGQVIAEHGFEKLGLIIIIAGLFQLLAGFVGIGQWFRAVSPAVIHGMLAGIGVLIFAGQFHVMVDDKPPGSGVEFGGIINLYSLPVAIYKGFAEPQHRPAALVGVTTILVIIAWTAFRPAKLKSVPAPLIGVVVATIMGMLMHRFGLDPHDIQVPDSLTEAFTLPTVSTLPLLLDKSIWIMGLTIAFIASAESLLTATAVDNMQQRSPRAKYDQELVAQGTGNLVCGFLGGLPLTGVIVRSAANVHAGACTRWSSVMHGVWLLVFAVLFPSVLRQVPVASLAAILVYTGVKLVDIKAIQTLYRFGASEVAIYFATLGCVVVFDLLTGVLVGLGLAIAKLIYIFSHLNIQKETVNGKTILHLEGAATFVRLPTLAKILENLPDKTELHVQFDRLTYIDHACLELLVNWEKQHKAAGGTLDIDWESLHARFRSEGNARTK